MNNNQNHLHKLSDTLLASLWNISAAPLLIVLYVYFPTLIFKPDALPYTHNFLFDSYYLILVTAIVLFGIGYFMPSRDLMLNRAIIWLGIFGKIGLTIIFFQLYILKYITLFFPIILIGDLIWAIFFFMFLYQTKDRVKINYFVG
jgi:hypothetical protein